MKEGTINFLSVEGLHEYLNKNVLWLSFERDCIAAAWGYAIAVALVSNLQQLQMKLKSYQ